MTTPSRIGSLAWAGLLVIVVGCSRANLDAIGPPEGPEPVTCPSAVLPAGDTSQPVEVDGDTRSYVLHVPSTYDGTKPVPLLLDFHALPGTGARERASSPYPALTDPDGAIMAFPNGLQGPSGGAWNVGPCCVADVDDVAFARAVVADVRNLACIDPRRVYAVGPSMGGGMAYYVACHAADVFAAIAPWAFDLLEQNVDDCKPTRPITVISFRGAADTFIPFEGGPSPVSVVPTMTVSFLGAKATFAKWAELDQCTDAPSAEDSNGCVAHSTCQGGVEVILCTKEGAGQEYNDASLGWTVLKRHTL